MGIRVQNDEAIVILAAVTPDQCTLVHSIRGGIHFRDHSGFAPDALTTFAHFAISVLR